MSSRIAVQACNYFRSEIQKMALNELDSFIYKFKNLWQTGRNASLSLKSNYGKVEAHLGVELGEAFAPVFQRSKNGPSRQKRRERRAAARNAGKAKQPVNVKEDTAVEASTSSTDTGILTTQNAENTAENGGVEMNLGTKVVKDKMNSVPTLFIMRILSIMMLLLRRFCWKLLVKRLWMKTL